MSPFQRCIVAALLTLAAAAPAVAQLEHRQSAYTVQVQNPGGTPLAGATVRVEMMNPAFRFGTAIVFGELYAGQSEYDVKGIDALQNYFNSVTFGNYMKWSYIEGRSDAATLSTINDVHALNAFGSGDDMRLRGHVTVWGAQYQLPADLRAMTDPAAVQTRIRNHVTDYHTLFKDAGVDNFDLYNEHFHEREFIIEKAVPSGGLADEAAEVAEWFKAAKAADPEAVLFINEYNILNFWQENDSDVIAYKTFVDAVRDAGGPVDGIGLQAHMDRLTTKAQALRRFSILSAPMAPTANHPEGLPGLRLEVTELDINTQGWTSATPAQQAEVTANVLDASFEHPAVDGVTIWGMRDSIHWRDNSILFDDSDPDNWVVKPSGQAWIDRVKGTWWTDIGGLSGSTGRYTGTVFKGKHRITVSYLGETKEYIRDITADGNLTVEFDAEPIDTSASFLSNLSVRAPLDADQTLSLGFVVDGGSKSVLTRVAGPALASFGITNFMPDPQLEIRQGETVIATNNDWDAATVSATADGLGAFTMDPGSKDTALIAAVSGPNTVEISGDAAGVVLSEVYDTAASSTGPRLSNVSALNFTSSGDNVLTAGFVVGGSGQARLLIRGVGPTLAELGVPNTLVDPKITVFQGSTVVATNDNWDGSLAGVASEVGAFALTAGSKDAALLAVVNAEGASYTVQVVGADGGTGRALIEVYEIR
ncbi:endo-1,4-beta-xylanase [Synoicihabitans lomoniglobus]|uniref:Beta-xylanase n=1 Tax=Synoicihabitans lomoniglobus TaxID=2909285 RepID=A0AAF0CRI1_9BACT|nr:endo-1,4-beta-xylanase [Opitutaceae bacterium LMO-M01]WED66740.1 endo-1,4-beta-xylanase [Opitutaceae bacterium LMO-M01]